MHNRSNSGKANRKMNRRLIPSQAGEAPELDPEGVETRRVTPKVLQSKRTARYGAGIVQTTNISHEKGWRRKSRW